MSIIECNDVSIRYITGDLKAIGLKEYVVRKLSNNYHIQEFWADKNVTFRLDEGDMLGIIGSNGAGKSTLLKAITGIMVPTGGSVKVHGKIAALLELASGFDANMTVRENAYLRGAMLGYTHEFMDKMYEDIIAFAELEDFQDYQFKQLSSGMKSRLAFAVACLVDPDVLILDEVLSVGDGAFQKKSGDKMLEIIHGGTTCILVSHSVGLVRNLCNKVLWLDRGNQIAFSDSVELYCDAYEEFLATKKLPRSQGAAGHDVDINALALAHAQRLEGQRKQQQADEAKRLQNVIEKGENEAAVLAAIKILQKSCPKALAEEYLAS